MPMEGEVVVRVLFFAKARELVKASTSEVPVPSVTTIPDLARALELKFPELIGLKGCFALALNEEFLTLGAKFSLAPGNKLSCYVLL